MPPIQTITDALEASTPAKTAMMILLPAIVSTLLFTSGIGSPMHLPRDTSSSPSLLDQAMKPILDRSGIPAVPTIDTSLTRKVSGVANKSVDIADDALNSVDVAVETGSRVIDFGADLVDQALTKASSSSPVSQ